MSVKRGREVVAIYNVCRSSSFKRFALLIFNISTSTIGRGIAHTGKAFLKEKLQQSASPVNPKTLPSLAAHLRSSFLDDAKGGVTQSRFMEVMAMCPGLECLSSVDVFAAFDRDSSGSVDYREFLLSLRALGAFSQEDLLRFCFDLMDADASGDLSREELASAMACGLIIMEDEAGQRQGLLSGEGDLSDLGGNCSDLQNSTDAAADASATDVPLPPPPPASPTSSSSSSLLSSSSSAAAAATTTEGSASKRRSSLHSQEGRADQERRLTQLFEAIDSNCSGGISFEEFINFFGSSTVRVGQGVAEQLGGGAGEGEGESSSPRLDHQKFRRASSLHPAFWIT
jgi:Ca2+-binding EF-hand superfamily protein